MPFLKLGGIDGESIEQTIDEYPDLFTGEELALLKTIASLDEADSFSFDVFNLTVSPEAPKPVAEEVSINFTKLQFEYVQKDPEDRSPSDLMEDLGKLLDVQDIDVRHQLTGGPLVKGADGPPTTYYKLTFDDIIVSNVRTGGSNDTEDLLI